MYLTRLSPNDNLFLRKQHSQSKIRNVMATEGGHRVYLIVKNDFIWLNGENSV